LRKQFYFVISDLKIIGHGNPDNNLESPCIFTFQSSGRKYFSSEPFGPVFSIRSPAPVNEASRAQFPTGGTFSL